ncbi:rRNA maturation RNase YbeY [Pleomorphovibrio marinus]|uniref:rRNA maturation RNase YbeY n=1 Tax=Pleomorphovibrio marinus TaxID=2164132 RepID=UPI000E0BB358|nr:rRNA maturation RNase YbeY [Pleomorphovibrio marinus]
MPIRFFTEDIEFSLPQKRKHQKWVAEIIREKNLNVGEINYVFCSDKYLHEVNLEYLNHDNYTDIITFDQSESEKEISGDVFISIDRVKENAELQNVAFIEELRRVLSHGLLHLMGYKDKTKTESNQMREQENAALVKFIN